MLGANSAAGGDLVADAVLQVAPRERAAGRGEVQHEDQDHRLLLLEADHAFRVDRRQRDRDGHAALVEHDAGQQPHEVAVAARFGERALQLPQRCGDAALLQGARIRSRALAQQLEREQRCNAVDDGQIT